MKVKPIEWRGSFAWCGGRMIGSAYQDMEEFYYTGDLFNDEEKNFSSYAEAKAWVEKQFKDFINSITTE